MPAIVRRTSTKVVNGRVTRKSRSDVSANNSYTVEKFPAGRGFTHVVSPRQLREFLEIVPDWPDLAYRLESIRLVGGISSYSGCHSWYRLEKLAVIELCAWLKKLWIPLRPGFFRQHRHIIEALEVPYQIGLTAVTCQFTVAQARAFTLLHVLLHEVGHHRDWLRRRGKALPDVEYVAEEFANRYWDGLFPIYCERFGHPARKTHRASP